MFKNFKALLQHQTVCAFEISLNKLEILLESLEIEMQWRKVS